MNMKKLISLWMAIVLSLAVFAGCDNTEPTTPEESTTGTVTVAPPKGEELIIIDNGAKSEYVIVTPEGASEAVTAAARTLQDAIFEKTGIKLAWQDDFVMRGEEIPETAKEILLGATNRKISETGIAAAPKCLDYAILHNGSQVSITAGKEETLQAAVAAFAERYIDGKTVMLPKNEAHIYLGEYAVDSLTVDGKPVQEYQIFASDAESTVCAKELQALVEETVGYHLEIVSRANKNKKYIRFCKSDSDEASAFSDVIGHFEAGWSCTDGELIFGSGTVVTAEAAIEQFGKTYLSGSTKNVALVAGTEVLQKVENDQLLSADDAYLSKLDEKAEAMKNNVLSATPDFSGFTGTKYYISNKGSDSADGKTPTTAWKTLDKLHAYTGFKRGDIILFERGSEWRGSIDLKQDGMMFAHYGETSKPLPIINGSDRNYADASLWEATSTPNVWKCKVSLYDVGVMVFDHSGEYGDYTAKRGRILFHKASDKAFYDKRGGAPLGVADLKEDLQFYSDLSSSTLYLYSASGNPGSRFSSIEIGTDKILINVGSYNGYTVDGIHFRFSGGFAIAGGLSNNIVVRNCVMEWIGGSVLSAEMLYGNAIQIYGQVKHFTVENNWIYQIYDTGITFQISANSQEICHYEDIDINNNLVEYCHWAIEFYNQPNGLSRSTTDVLIEENFCRYGGMGWGSEFRHLDYDAGTARDASAALLCSWGFGERLENFVVKNNIFDRCTGKLGLVTLTKNDGDKLIELEGNTYVQTLNESFGKIFGTFYNMNSTSYGVMTETLRDQDGTLAFIVPEG